MPDSAPIITCIFYDIGRSGAPQITVQSSLICFSVACRVVENTHSPEDISPLLFRAYAIRFGFRGSSFQTIFVCLLLNIYVTLNMSDQTNAAERLRSRKPIPKPVPAYLPSAGSPLAVPHALYDSFSKAPRTLVEEFVIPIRSGRAWKAPAGSIVRISTPEGPQVGTAPIAPHPKQTLRFSIIFGNPRKVLSGM